MAIRKVHFYRVSAGVDAAGRLNPVDLQPALAAISGLGFDTGGRYLDDADGNALCAWPTRHAGHLAVSFGAIRRSDLPDVERAGALEPLRVPPGAGIVEQTHIVFYPQNVVGCLFNFYGPRMSKLVHYLRQKYGATPRSLRFDPLLRTDVLEQIDRFGQIRVLQLDIRRSFADRVAAANETLGRGLQATMEASDAEQVDVVLKPRPRRRNFLSGAITNVVRMLAREHDLQEEARKFKVQGVGADGNLEWIDVLKSRFIVEKHVDIEGRRRTVRPDSAFAAIHSAYLECEDQVSNAAHIQ